MNGPQVFIALLVTGTFYAHWLWSHRFGTEMQHTWSLRPRGVAPVPTHLFTMTSYPLNAAVNATLANNPGWKFHGHTVASAEAFMKAECPAYVAAFTRLIPLALKADVFRACALWALGGVWFDDDLIVEALLALNGTPGSLLLVHDAPHWDGPIPMPFTLHERDIWNAFMLARVPRHPVFLCVLDHALDVVMLRRPISSKYEIAGPRAVGGCLAPYTDATIIGLLQPNGAHLWGSEHIIATHTNLAARNTTVPHYRDTDRLFH